MIKSLWYKLKYIVIGVVRERLDKPERSTQEILNIVIRTNEYNSKKHDFMCGALNNARYNGYISRDESRKVAREIVKYLNGWAFLQTALAINYLPSEFEYRKKLYLNWADRPTILSEEQLKANEELS